MMNYPNFMQQPYKSPEQYMNEYQALLGQYQSAINKTQQPQQQPQNSGISYSGIYQYVNSYDEVANAPVPTDGTAKLFINFNQKIMWAKKFTDGKHNIQTYLFDVYNGENELPIKKAEEKQQEIENPLDKINERLEKLENKYKRKKTEEMEESDEL